MRATGLAATLALLLTAPLLAVALPPPAIPTLNPSEVVPLPCDALAPAGVTLVQAAVCGGYTPAAPLPAPREGLGLVWLENVKFALAFGGRDASGTTRGELWAYDPAANAWTARASGPPRADMVFVAKDHDASHNQAFLFGGRDGTGAKADVWRYDYDADAWTDLGPTPGPAPRYGAAGAYDYSYSPGGTFVGLVDMFGGTDGAVTFGDLWHYVPSTNSWSVGPSGPTARAFATSSWDTLRLALIVHGGRAADGTLLLDTKSYERGGVDKWFDLADGPAGRSHGSLIYEPDHTNFLMFGGVTALGATAEAWTFGPAEGLWLQATSAPFASLYDASPAVWDEDHQVAYLGGGMTPSGPTDAFWAYAPGLPTWGM